MSRTDVEGGTHNHRGQVSLPASSFEHFGVAHAVGTHSHRPAWTAVMHITLHERVAHSGHRRGPKPRHPPSRAVLAQCVRAARSSFQAACGECSRCHLRSRFQQISASLRAAATRALFDPARLRTR